jgi:hypothetical protein
VTNSNGKPVLNGTWEQNGRSPIAGAFLLVVGAGSIYFLVQTILLNGAVILDMFLQGPETGTTQSVYERYQALILSVAAVTQYLLLLLPTLMLVKRWHTPQRFSYLRFDAVPVVGVMVATVGIVALLPLVELLARLFYSLAPELQELQGNVDELITAETVVGRLLIYLAIAVTPALCEETLFRGYFQRTLQRRMRGWHFLISGTLFALFHQQILTLPSLIIVGIYLSYMFFAYDSVWVTIVAHFTYNAVQVFMVNRAQPLPAIITEEGFTTPAFVVGTLIAAASVGVAERTRRHRRIKIDT